MARTKTSKSLTDEELIAQGMAAYTAGVHKGNNPFGDPDTILSGAEKHHKAFMWRMGWGRGYFADYGGKDVPIYTGVPMDCTPLMVEQRKLDDVHQRRKNATPLPWTMDELVGSTWVNLWTGSLQTITHLYCNSAGKPEPGWHCSFADIYAHIHGLGVWLQRYTIDDWVRFDTMELALQDLWRIKTTRRAFEDMQREQRSSQPKQQTVRAVPPTIKQAEEPSSQQLPLF